MLNPSASCARPVSAFLTRRPRENRLWANLQQAMDHAYDVSDRQRGDDPVLAPYPYYGPFRHPIIPHALEFSQYVAEESQSRASCFDTNRMGIASGRADMRLVRGSHGFVWASLAALLCAGPANPDGDGKAASALLDVAPAVARSDAALSALDLTAPRPEPDASVTGADQIVKVVRIEPEANTPPLKAPDECLMAKGRCTNARARSIPSR